MNEAETRAELIDPLLKLVGWGMIEGTKVLREYAISKGRIQTDGKRGMPDIADYVLVYNNQKLAVIEAKREELEATEGVAQAKEYANKLQVTYTYSTNGKKIYQINMETGKEQYVDGFPSPMDLLGMTHKKMTEWKEKFLEIPFEDVNGTKAPRYYQEIAVNRVMDAIAEEKNRILLTLATGTGKTFIAFQIAWKLYQSRWNLKRDGSRRPRILFLADRNILANQAWGAFSAFPEDALTRIKPLEIRRRGGVPTNASVFFTIFQTFMSGPNNAPYFGEYPKDFFDFIIIDECHRGGANDEGNWRGILEYFSPAVQLGLTATPKRKDNADTYRYFGDPVYSYSLKEGINDGFLTPFKVKRIQTNLDEYVYTSDDQVIEGEVEEGKVYTEPEFNRTIVIEEREKKRVRVMMDEIDQKEKTLVFCATQTHAGMIRDIINQMKESKDPNYCVRVTANDGVLGEQYLSEFQDNEKNIPTILTTSQKLSTGVDALNVRNIVLLRPVNSMIEFKQIIGRGTRTFDGKNFFTIYDFVGAYKNFLDPEWDGEPIEVVTEQLSSEKKGKKDPVARIDVITEELPPEKKKLKIKLRNGKERELQHMISTVFFDGNGKPLSSQEFLQNLYGELPELFKDEQELRKIWSDPGTRKALLEKLSGMGYGIDVLEQIKPMIHAENSDLYDVLANLSFMSPTMTRKERVDAADGKLYEGLNDQQREFIEFVVAQYLERGTEDLDGDKLKDLLHIKYHSIQDAEDALGSVEDIRNIFLDFQRRLYEAANKPKKVIVREAKTMMKKR